MQKADVREITVARDDGTHEKVEHGAVVEMEGDDIGISFVNMPPLDIVRLAIGVVKAVQHMGMGEVLNQMVSYYGEESADGGAEKM